VSRRDAVRLAWEWLTRTFAGRLLLLSLGIKAIVWTVRAATQSMTALNGLNSIASALLIVALVVIGYRAYLHLKRVVLWRVRRKLTLSYVFIGLVPVLLLVLFFSVAGLLLFFNVGGYLLRTRLATLVDRAQSLAQTAAADLAHVRGAADTTAALARHQQAANAQFPLVSYAVVPSSAACAGGTIAEARGPVATAGPWQHVQAPSAVPEWVSCAGFGNLVAGPDASAATPWLAARGVAWVTHGDVREAVIVDVPVSGVLMEQLARDTGVTLRTVQLYDDSVLDGVLDGADPDDAAPAASSTAAEAEGRRITLGPDNVSLGSGLLSGEVRWSAIVDYTGWERGDPEQLLVRFDIGLVRVYEHLSASAGRISDISIGQLLLFVLAIVALLFLIILIVAFLMGFVLARSITGAVHELFEGTEKVRSGDFSHKIVVRSRDQLGELAESFNSMTASIEDLLQQKAQKERLEQELRIARGIQMSLLPQEPLSAAGLSFAGHCEPAREVGGDYYDFWAIDDHRFGMLIADVAGKGTSAALYMAELKGIVLSFSQSHNSPRQLLIDANRIISNHLDTRRFITMTYGVVDVRARTLTYARAGHCPLIRLPGPSAPSQAAEVLAPDGLVLGLKIDDGEMFARLLEEATVPIAPGDVFLLYTDGLTEAMNASGDFFGEDRLSALVQSHGTAPFHQLRDEILAAITSFTGPAEQQDDMTMLLLRVQAMEHAAA
jgi:sigma-B regulation protein RsbU (phosphoserine phosphatase)